MVSLSDADPVVTVTLDSGDENNSLLAELSGDEPLVVVHREADITTPTPTPTSTAPASSSPAESLVASNSNVAASHAAFSMDNMGLDPHSWLGAASLLLGAEGGLRATDAGSREQIHNRHNARDKAVKAAEGNVISYYKFC